MTTYLVQRRCARTTGSYVEIYDITAPENDFDPDGGRWVTFCDKHLTLCNHSTKALAIAHAAYPAGWCEECYTDYAPTSDGGPRTVSS